jgi:hypothetical protein
MTNDSALWTALQSHLPRNQWIHITDIFSIIQHQIPLDPEDLARGSGHSILPLWQRNVRRVLRTKQLDGTLQHRKSLS